MRYLLRKEVIAKVPEIDITEGQYLEYEEARNVLLESLAIEETYEILIVSYIEFENETLSSTTSHMVRHCLSYPDIFQIRLGINMRLVNLLTASRLYVDQLPQHVRGCLSKAPNAIDDVRALLAKEYDAHFEYRFMEALRNHVQHRGIPVHWTQLGGRWTSLGDDGLLEFSIEMGALRSHLEEDGEFKKAVLDEMGEKADLKATTRCYIECISNVHCAAREMVREEADRARGLFKDAHKRYAAEWDRSLAGLSACAWSDDGEEQVSSVPLMLDLDDIRLELIRRNEKLVNLRRRYVTGQLKR